MPHGACCHAKAGTAERKAYMTILIKNGHVVDPLTRIDGDYDVLIEDNRIKKVAAMIEEAAGQVIDAKGCYVMCTSEIRAWNIKRPSRPEARLP